MTLNLIWHESIQSGIRRDRISLPPILDMEKSQPLASEQNKGDWLAGIMIMIYEATNLYGYTKLQTAM